MKKGILAVGIAPLVALLFFTGCATTGGIPDQVQKEAQLRTIGRGMGAALVIADPEIIPAAEEYCLAYGAVSDAVQAQGLIKTAFTFLVEDYAENEVMVEAVMDALIAIGFTDAALVQVAASSSIDGIEMPQMTPEVIQNTQLILDGFCAMLKAAPRPPPD